MSRPSVARRFLPDRKLAYAILSYRPRCPECTPPPEDTVAHAIEVERIHLASESRRRYARQRKAAA